MSKILFAAGSTLGTLVAPFLLLLLAPLPVLAEGAATPTPDSFMPGTSDLTGHIVRSIFGDWNNGRIVPVVGEAMNVLNLFALSFGTLMFTYVAVVGTLNTAQDGEVLGKKWSSMWVPFRFTVGTALLVPLASGYSTVQHIILWLAMAGGGAASLVWGAALDSFTNPDKAAAMVQNSEEYKNKVRTLMRGMLKAEICTALLNTQYPGTFGMSGPTETRPGLFGSPIGSTYVPGYAFKWGDATGTGGKSANTCGDLTTTDFTMMAPTAASYGGVYGAMAVAALPALSQEAEAERLVYVGLAQGQRDGVIAAVNVLRPVAEGLVAAPSSDAQPTSNAAQAAAIEAGVSAAATAYLAQVTPRADPAKSALVAKLSAFITSSKDSGWMMASSSFFQMARIRSAATEAITGTPKFQARTDTKAGESGRFQGVAEAPVYEDIAAAEDKITNSFQGEAESGFFANPGLYFSRILGQAFSFNPEGSNHSLVQIKNTGDRILMSTGTLAAGAVAAHVGGAWAGGNVVGNIVGSVTGAKAAAAAFLEVAGPVIMLGFFALFGVGITMAFLLPMLPFMLSIGSILGWLMALFSAMVAAPIWLAGHLHPEGDGFAGKAVGGYMILLETITRPIFLVFGLIGAFLIMDPVLRFVSWSFQANMQSLEGNSWTGLISIGMYTVMYVAIVWTVTRQSLQLIHSLSEKVYIWVGGQNAGYDQARDFGAAAQASTARAGSGLAQGWQAGTAAAAKGMDRRETLLKAKDNPSKVPKSEWQD